MDRSEAERIVKVGKASCPRCHGTGIYKWGHVVDGIPDRQGTCFKCLGDAFVPASRRQVIEAERVLGLRPPAKPRKPKPRPAESEWDACPVPF